MVLGTFLMLNIWETRMTSKTRGVSHLKASRAKQETLHVWMRPAITVKMDVVCGTKTVCPDYRYSNKLPFSFLSFFPFPFFLLPSLSLSFFLFTNITLAEWKINLHVSFTCESPIQDILIHQKRSGNITKATTSLLDLKKTPCLPRSIVAVDNEMNS